MKFIAVLVAALVAVGCSGKSKLGEACDAPGKTEGECESGGICGKDTNGAVMCLKICKEQTDCSAAEECNGVDGSNVKGCRQKSASPTPGVDAGKK